MISREIVDYLPLVEVNTSGEPGLGHTWMVYYDWPTFRVKDDREQWHTLYHVCDWRNYKPGMEPVQMADGRWVCHWRDEGGSFFNFRRVISKEAIWTRTLKDVESTHREWFPNRPRRLLSKQ